MKTWLFSIARYKWCGHLRSKTKQFQTESLHDLYDSHFIGLQTTDLAGDLQQVLQELLQMESELNRVVFQMRLEGYSYFEIASQLGISESSARVVFFRTKATIKKQLEKEGFFRG